MKLKLFFATLIATLGIFACTMTASAAVRVQVTKPAFNVAVNGRYVDNDYRQYPFIVYKDITYFPMTYNDCAFLGLSNSWSFETGTVLNVTASNGVYDDMITARYNEDISEYDGTHLFYATITEGPIWVNNNYINNAAQQYPILTFRDVPYFPLTWDWCRAFGWTSSFTSEGGLSVCSPEYAGALGYVNYYSPDGTTYSCTMKAVDMLKSAVYDGNYSFSPYYFNDYHAGLTAVYQINVSDLSSDFVYIPNDKIQYFNSNGWYTYSQFSQLAQSLMNNSSMTDIANAFSHLHCAPTEINTARLYADSTSDTLKTDYISVWSYDQSNVKCIKRSDVDAYRAAAWFSYDDLAIAKVKALASQGMFPEAVLLCSTITKRLRFTDNAWYVDNYDLPYIIEDELDPSYTSTYNQLARTYSDSQLAYSRNAVSIPWTYKSIHDSAFHFPLINMAYQPIIEFETEWYIYDHFGNVKTTKSTYISSSNSPSIQPASATYFSISINCNAAALKKLTVKFADWTSITYTMSTSGTINVFHNDGSTITYCK